MRRFSLLGAGLAALLPLATVGACGGGDDDDEGGSGASGNAGGTGGLLGGSGGLGNSGAGNSGGNGAGSGDDWLGGKPEAPMPEGCNDLAVEWESVIPTVMLVVDRSSSMFDIAFGDSPNRWDPLKDALVGPGGVVKQLQSGVRFGFTAYTHQSVNGEGACPLLNDAGSIGLDNHDAIKEKYDEASSDPRASAPSPINSDESLPYKGETPTGAAIRAVTPELAAYSEIGPKYILLVTDGEPDTCAHPDPQCGQAESIAAVQAAHAEGIQTIVIGAGEVGREHLQDLANAGAGQPVQQRPLGDCDEYVSSPQATYADSGGDAPYYFPQDPEALRSAIAYAVGSVRSCEFTMNVEVDPEGVGDGQVWLDGKILSHDDPDGWHMSDQVTVVLEGKACERIKTQINPGLVISFPCDVIVR